jgi:DNA-binding response OmpR family regulator
MHQCARACSSLTTTAPSAQPLDNYSNGAASSSWLKPETARKGCGRRRSTQPDFAIVDVQLPDLDGFEVAERLRALDVAPEVILTSSLDGTDFGALVASSSALGFIPKAELSARAIEALLAPTR